MKQFKLVCAFGLGCLIAFSFNYDRGVTAQRSKAGSNPEQNRLKALEQRAADLERSLAGGILPAKKVTAPFEITDQSGQKIFDVTSDGFSVYRSGRRMAEIGGHKDGGYLWANSATGYYGVSLDTAAGSPQLSVIENNSPRIELGRGQNGTYRLKVTAGDGKTIAGLGEERQSHKGLILIYDKSGNLKARMAISDDGKGLFDAIGINNLPIVQLTESSSGGGRMIICSVSGCDPPMVEAGDAGGYGIVRVGPHGFNPGVTMLGLPGSVIMGKSQ